MHLIAEAGLSALVHAGTSGKWNVDVDWLALMSTTNRLVAPVPGRQNPVYASDG